MILDKEEIKKQTRELWETCFQDSPEFTDIYFEDKYSDEANLTFRADGVVTAAVQVLPYRQTFYGQVAHAGYLSGLATAPEFRKKGMAAQLIREAHRKLFRQGALMSFLIPGSEELRHFYERSDHGAYWTAAYRKETEITIGGEVDPKVEITQPEEWGNNLYVFYRKYTKEQSFMLHPSESDFFAALEACDLAGGKVLVAHRKRRLLGLCLAVVESDGRCFLRSLLSVDETVKDCFLHYLQQQCGVKQVYARIAVPGSLAGAVPYAMARVVNVEKFLQTVVQAYPSFQLHIGVDGDTDIPENNGYYMVDEGKVVITDQRPESIVTPGGLAAMFLGAHPMTMEMMLDE